MDMFILYNTYYHIKNKMILFSMYKNHHPITVHQYINHVHLVILVQHYYY